MGLKDKAELPEVWRAIREAAASNIDAQTCMVLVGHDVDGIAASSMFSERPAAAWEHHDMSFGRGRDRGNRERRFIGDHLLPAICA